NLGDAARFNLDGQDVGYAVAVTRPIAMISEDRGFVNVGLDAASLVGSAVISSSVDFSFSFPSSSMSYCWWWWYHYRRGSVIVIMAMTASRHSHRSCHAVAGGFLQSLGWGVSDSTLPP
ncbi:1982_t:CDS:2, partial [Acaulospora morrowiae]